AGSLVGATLLPASLAPGTITCPPCSIRRGCEATRAGEFRISLLCSVALGKGAMQRFGSRPCARGSHRPFHSSRRPSMSPYLRRPAAAPLTLGRSHRPQPQSSPLLFR
ncbi:unnamed protein product, partial [Musa textilis]